MSGGVEPCFARPCAVPAAPLEHRWLPTFYQCTNSMQGSDSEPVCFYLYLSLPPRIRADHRWCLSCLELSCHAWRCFCGKMSLRFALGIPVGGGVCLPTLLELSNIHLVKQACVVLFTSIRAFSRSSRSSLGLNAPRYSSFSSKLLVPTGVGLDIRRVWM